MNKVLIIKEAAEVSVLKRRCAREAVNRMSTQQGGADGVIVNLSSAAYRLGSAGEYVDSVASLKLSIFKIN